MIDYDDDVLHWYWRPGRGLHLGRLGCTVLLLPAALLHCTALFKVIIVGLHCSTANRATRGNALQDCNIALHLALHIVLHCSTAQLHCTVGLHWNALPKDLRRIAPPVSAQPAAGPDSTQIVFFLYESDFCRVEPLLSTFFIPPTASFHEQDLFKITCNSNTVWQSQIREVLEKQAPLKILALPKRGGWSDPCQDFFGGFDILYRGQPKGIIDPQK